MFNLTGIHPEIFQRLLP